MNNLIKARANDIVVQPAGNELLIYDFRIHKAFCLNETSAVIYQACDKAVSIDELKTKTKLPEEIILLAIKDFERENLLEANLKLGPSRRSLLAKAAYTAVALPVIASIIAPTAAHAQSGCVATGMIASATSNIDAEDCNIKATIRCCSRSSTVNTSNFENGTYTCSVNCFPNPNP